MYILAGYSPWGHKELYMTERLSTAQHSYLCYLSIYKYGHTYFYMIYDGKNCECVKTCNLALGVHVYSF